MLSVNADGLCRTCNPIVIRDIVQRKREIARLARTINVSGNFVSKVQRCDTVIRHLISLEDYERRGIPIRDLSPSVLLAEYRQGRERILSTGLEKLVSEALTKAEVTISVNGKIREASKGLLKLQEFTGVVNSPGILEALTAKIKTFIQTTQLNGYLEAAKKAEFKARYKRALDQYREALYFLNHVEIDDRLKTRNIPEIERKISELE